MICLCLQHNFNRKVTIINFKNMKTASRLLTILLLLIFCFNVSAQEDNKLTKKEANILLDKAELNFEEKNYIDALDKFTQLYNYKPSDLYYKLMMGICLSYNPEQKSKAVEIIEQVKVTNPENNLVDFYLAKAYAVNYQFDKAVELFNIFISKSTVEDVEQKSIAEQMIQNCINAKEILADTISENIVENIKYPINSQYSEYVPVISADESVMIYTYRGINSKGAEDIEQSMGSEAYMEDVFISYKINGEWSEPKSIGDKINTKNHDAAIALSVDGQTLFIYKSENNNLGDIYVSRLVGEDWTSPDKLKGEVNSNKSWEGSASLSANSKILYFASDREGGLGGRDIYKAELQADGSWANVQNLGPTINTAYNDDAPFIHPDNKTLYFSSEGHSSIGGYDIFSSTLDENGTFGELKNLGYPINTIDDNRYFVLSASGKTGYYSGGGENSIGEQDIFKITTGKIEKPVLALLLGKVYFNDVPTGSTMNLYKQVEGELEGTFVSNEKTGKYVMTLTPGIYEIVVELASGEVISDSVRLDEIKEYVVLHKDFRIYSDSNLIEKNNPALQALLDVELNKEEKTIDTLFTVNIDEKVELKPMDAGREFKLNNILYDFDKATLRLESVVELDRLVIILTEQAAIKVEISSHTDSKGSDEYNQKLSQARAKSVTDYLTKKGIDKNRLLAKGYGESKPVATNDNDDGRQLNRRTEFKVLESK
ncbi:MAG: hypothetical protein CO118_03340 [Flavobacteriales bacterium CG_4_9_14_3_um_filter_32_8]|nr:MAG: hypothetical protein CO118_03340 [Flavobacteriales bacterium CG_4_9_14_3_um_filter_32_8]